MKIHIDKVCLRIMKIATLLFFLCSFQLYAEVFHSQSPKLSLEMRNNTVEEVINKIEKETNFKFVFTDKAVDTSRKVNIHVSNGELKEVLDQLVQNTALDYRIVDQLIVLSEKKYIAPQQGKKQITGTVVDESGEPMIGVNVVEAGTTNGVTTNIDGGFNLSVAENATLQISYIGYVTQQIAIRNQTTIKVVLKEDALELDEVVAIGYGTKRRSSVSGAIDQLGTQTFEDRPVGNAMQALQGSSPNLIIQQRSMNPSDNTMNINIRGVSSMNNSDPLLVIDGMIASGLDALTTSLNPNDIETVTILKDASSAIYGSRSANGVILVTTKQGAKGSTPKVRFSGMVGVNAPEILYRPVAGWKNAELRNHSNEVTGLPLTYTQAQIDDLKAHEGESEWYMDQIYENALQQSYNLSLSGGTNNTNYMVSLGYYNQENNFVGSWGRERYNFRVNLGTEWGKFKVGTTLAYNRTMDRQSVSDTGGLNTNAFRVPQYYYYKMKSDDGKYLINDCVVDANALGQLEQGGYQKRDNDNIVGNINIEYTIMDGLKAKALGGIDLVQSHRFRRWIQVPLYWESNLETPARYINSNRDVDDLNNKYYNLNTQFLLDFNRTFASDHYVSAMVGVSNESYTQEQSMIRWRYTDPDLGLNTGENATQTGQSGSNYTTNQNNARRSITSFFGRAGYNYKNKYYFDFTFRYDGSSKFAKDYRWGFFPSFSAAYRLSEEDFMTAYKENVGNLKVRASYGILGIQSVGDYAYLTTYTQQTNRYGFNNTAYPGFDLSIGNEQLSWESSANFNVGFDASFFNNKLDFTFDWFKKRTYDILLTPVVPMVFGTSSAGTQNLGEMENTGWEVSLSYRGKTGDFGHRVSFNIADAKNKVTDFGGREQLRQGEETWNIIREGEALGSYYGYKSAGLFQSQEEINNSALPPGAIVQPGDVKYVDTNKDGVINELDRRVLGNAFPRYTFGLTYDLTWKGFDLNILIQGVGKRLQQIRGEMSEPFHHLYWVSTMFEHQMDFWTPENTGASLPRLATDGPSRQNNYQKIGTDIILYDMAYLRVKNIRLGYTIPKKISSKALINKAHISFNVQNPFTISKNSWADPEVTNFGNNMGGRGGVGGFYLRGSYPLLRYYGVSIDLEF